jgi:hypothetical protein
MFSEIIPQAHRAVFRIEQADSKMLNVTFAGFTSICT